MNLMQNNGQVSGESAGGERDVRVKMVRGDYCNTYVVEVCGKTIVVDAGAAVEMLGQINVDYIFITHAHYDHFCYLNDYLRAFAGARVLLSARACEKIEDVHLSVASEFFGVESLSFDKTRFEVVGESTRLCGLDVEFVELSGHTDCALGMIVGECLFSGDAIFVGGIGRYDLPTGDFEAQMRTLEKIRSMQGIKCIYAGHGDIINKENT